jgi:ankyrin repeat protein
LTDIAASQGRLELLQFLLQKCTEPTNQVQIDERNARNQTALHIALANGHIKYAKALIDAGANASVADVLGTTAVHLTVERNQPELLEILLKRGASTEGVKRDTQETPLLIAIAKRHVECVRLLLENGASVQVQDKQQNNVLHLAAETCSNSILQMILEKTKARMVNSYNLKEVTPLIIAVQQNFVEAVEAFLKLPDVNVEVATKTDHYTPVSIAAQKGFLEILKLLMAAKANLNDESAYEETPIILALQNGHVECALELLSGEVTMYYSQYYYYLLYCRHVVDENGNSPLFLAASKGYCEVIEKLIALHRANAQTSDREFLSEQNGLFQTPLLIAVKNNQYQAAKLLVDAGATIDTCDANNDSCFHWCVVNGNTGIFIKTLLR